MTTFEYLAIAFSLVYSFAAMRIIAGLPHAAQAGRRYGPHLTFTAMQLFTVVLAFWAYLSLRDVSWTLPAFLLALANPVLLYFGACMLIPDDPAKVASWRDHYYGVRRRFWLAVVAWAFVATIAVTVLVDTPWLHPIRVVHGTALAIGVTGAATANERVHAGLAVFIVVFSVVSASLVAVPEGFLAR